MGRQILTFVLVFVGIFLLMQTCSKPPPQQRGLPVVKPDALPAGVPMKHAASGAEVLLAPDGSVASIMEKGVEVVRPVTAGRRPFRLNLGRTDQHALLPVDGWTAEELPEGGRRHVLAKDKLRIERKLDFTEDGHGLVLQIKAEGVPGLILTGASGAALTGEDFGSPFAFAQYAGKEPEKFTFSELKQKREADRGRLYADFLERAGRVQRFGLFGRDFCLSLEDLPEVSKLYMDVYRAAREEGETDEAETWADLVAPEGAFEGTFTLRWKPRVEAARDFPSAELEEGREVVLEDDAFRVVFTTRGAAIRELFLKGYSTVAGEPPSALTWVPLLGAGVPEGERTLTLAAEGHGANPAHRVWEALPAPDGRSIRFSLVLPDGFRLWKTIELPAAGRFDLGVEVGIEAPAGGTGQAVLSLVGPSGSYIVDSYRGIISADPPAAFILDRSGDEETEPIDALQKEILETGYAEARRGQFKAVGTRGAYFVCALVSEDKDNAVTNALARPITLDRAQARGDGKPPTRDGMLGRVSLALQLDAGSASQKFRLYAGPNETAALRALDIGGSVNFGFFGSIGRALMWLMKALEGLVGSYGIAIMLMTVIVRAILLPISFKTQLSMQRYGKKMQKIKPLLEEVQKKHAKDPARMNQERMKIMREHGLGLPLGCLTIFLQIPIWYALFQALRVEFALRHQPFLWAHDLSMPDRLFGLPVFGFMPLSWLPHWFNLLPILMLVLWVIQQRLTPTPGSDDPQVKMQMKMMKFMPYVFFFFLYNYAAGLALYMCVSSCWSIAESKLVRRAIAKLG